MKITLGTLSLEAETIEALDQLIERLPKIASYAGQVASATRAPKAEKGEIAGEYSEDQLALFKEALEQGNSYSANFLAITGGVRIRRNDTEKAKHGADIEGIAKERMEVALGMGEESGEEAPSDGEEIDKADY